MDLCGLCKNIGYIKAHIFHCVNIRMSIKSERDGVNFRPAHIKIVFLDYFPQQQFLVLLVEVDLLLVVADFPELLLAFLVVAILASLS